MLDQHCWFNSDYLNWFWEEAITIILKRPDISVCLNTFAFAFAPNRFAFAQIRNPRAAVSRRLPPTSQSFDWKNQWVRVQQRLVCPKMHFPHWNIYGSSFVKIIVAIDVKYHLWPPVNPALFSRPNHLRWGQIGRQPPIKAFRLIWSWCGVLRGRKLTHLRLKQVRRLSSINT